MQKILFNILLYFAIANAFLVPNDTVTISSKHYYVADPELNPNMPSLCLISAIILNSDTLILTYEGRWSCTYTSFWESHLYRDGDSLVVTGIVSEIKIDSRNTLYQELEILSIMKIENTSICNIDIKRVQQYNGSIIINSNRIIINNNYNLLGIRILNPSLAKPLFRRRAPGNSAVDRGY